jgi:hypothetical protein
MAVKDTSLVTLAKTKQHLDITTSREDGELEMLIDAVSKFVSEHCDRDFKYEEDHAEIVDGTGLSELMVRKFPIIGSVTLEEDVSGNSTPSWNTVNAGDYWVDDEEGILELVSGVFTKRRRKYRVTKDCGFVLQDGSLSGDQVALPNDLELAVLKLISGVFNKRKAEGTKTQTLQNYTVEFETVLNRDPFVMSVLQNYANQDL